MSRKTSKSLKEQLADPSSLTLAAVALQDHWSRSLSLGTNFGPRKIGLGPAARAQQKREAKAVVDTRRTRVKKKTPEDAENEKEYVLDAQPPPLTLAQKFGLVHAPKPLLSEQEWSSVKEKSNQRDDSKEPCVICKEDFGLQEQVLLSCTHVFHRACLQAFERFTGRKTCPMCRHEQYQTRVIHEGARVHKHKSAAQIQAWWRGYVVRCWYKQLRETVPPKDPMLRKKFYEEKLSGIVDRMIRSLDVNMTEFLREIDSSVQQSRAVFSQWDAVHNQILPEQWEAIQLKAVERGDLECPICLTELQLMSDFSNSDNDTAVPEPDHNATHTHGHTKIKTQSKPPTKSVAVGKTKRQQEDRKLLEKLSLQAGHGLQEANRQEQHDDGSRNKTQTQTTKHAQSGPAVGQHKLQSQRAQAADSLASGSDAQNLHKGLPQRRHVRSTVLLSCTHVFHSTCLQTLEEIAMLDMRNTCPVCRAHYQKKVIVF